MPLPSVDEEELTKLYEEFAEEGIADYTKSLAKEDKQ